MVEHRQPPSVRTKNPCFSSGPCAKRPGWSPDVLKGSLLGRSHRSLAALEKFKEATRLMRKILSIPDDYKMAIITGSNTAAFEFGLWKLLGCKGVDIVSYEAFGRIWKNDIINELRLEDVRCFDAKDGEIPDLSQIDGTRDLVFVWVGTPTCATVPGDDWIPADREGLVFCDAVSALGVVPVDWSKLDFVSFSWQKIFGGEATHGVAVLSPRAVERMNTYKPSWPVPRLFRLRGENAVWDEAFLGSPVNTVSMLVVEDCIDALKWADALGGLPALAKRAKANHDVVARWVEKHDWIDYLVEKLEHRAAVCVSLKFTDPSLSDADKKHISSALPKLLAKEGIAFDINSHEDAPPGLRFWTGPTVEKEDLEALLPWVEWAYESVKCTLQS